MPRRKLIHRRHISRDFYQNEVKRQTLILENMIVPPLPKEPAGDENAKRDVAHSTRGRHPEQKKKLCEKIHSLRQHILDWGGSTTLEEHMKIGFSIDAAHTLARPCQRFLCKTSQEIFLFEKRSQEKRIILSGQEAFQKMGGKKGEGGGWSIESAAYKSLTEVRRAGFSRDQMSSSTEPDCNLPLLEKLLTAETHKGRRERGMDSSSELTVVKFQDLCASEIFDDT